MTALGWSWRCSLQVSVLCSWGETKPSVSKCRYCGGRLLVRRGLWGTFVWNGEGRYPEAQAVQTFASYARAERAAGRTLVVRFIPQEA